MVNIRTFSAKLSYRSEQCEQWKDQIYGKFSVITPDEPCFKNNSIPR